MTVTLDKFGRVLIPKGVRDRLGLRPGAELALDVRDEGDGAPALELRPGSAESSLQYRDGLLVHTGTLDADVDVVDLIRQQRDERTRKLMGLDR